MAAAGAGSGSGSGAEAAIDFYCETCMSVITLPPDRIVQHTEQCHAMQASSELPVRLCPVCQCRLGPGERLDEHRFVCPVELLAKNDAPVVVDPATQREIVVDEWAAKPLRFASLTLSQSEFADVPDLICAFDVENHFSRDHFDIARAQFPEADVVRVFHGTAAAVEIAEYGFRGCYSTRQALGPGTYVSVTLDIPLMERYAEVRADAQYKTVVVAYLIRTDDTVARDDILVVKSDVFLLPTHILCIRASDAVVEAAD